MKSLWDTIVVWFIQDMPGAIGYRLRYAYYKKRLKHLGDDVRIDVNVYIDHPEYVTIKNRCAIDRGTVILAGPDRTNREKVGIVNPNFRGQPGEVIIGSCVHISPHCIVSGRSGGVSIGNECALAAKVTLHSFSNHYRSNKRKDDTRICFTPLVEQERQSMISGPIVLSDNVGVAINAAILPGVYIASKSFVTINSVVMPGSRFKENSLISGNPARAIGKRFV